MSLLGPDGRPVSTRQITDQQLIGALNALNQKIDALGNQQLHISMFLDWVFQHLQTAEKPDGTPLVEMNMEEFQGWANDRLAQMRAEAADQMRAAAEEVAAQADALESEEDEPEVILDDE